MTKDFKTLKPGTVLDNAGLCEYFGCSPQGGMRRSLKTNTLVIISNHVESIYEDRWIGDELHYTGMGQVGDQELKSQNKTLAESHTNGVSVHLFEVFTDKELSTRALLRLSVSLIKRFNLMRISKIVPYGSSLLNY